MFYITLKMYQKYVHGSITIHKILNNRPPTIFFNKRNKMKRKHFFYRFRQNKTCLDKGIPSLFNGMAARKLGSSSSRDDN